MTIIGPVPLDGRHDTSTFDSGAEVLDHWLRTNAWPAQRSDSTKVYVIHEASRVVGFYALSAGSVRPEYAPTRVGKGQGQYDLPIVLLARLGVDKTIQGQRYRAALLKDALMRVAGAADIVGARALHAHAKDDDAKRFHERFGFEASPVDPRGMFLLLKDLRAAIAAG